MPVSLVFHPRQTVSRSLPSTIASFEHARVASQSYALVVHPSGDVLTSLCEFIYHIISYHIISYHIISYLILSYLILSYLILSYLILSRRVFASSRLVLAHLILSYLILSYLTLSSYTHLISIFTDLIFCKFLFIYLLNVLFCR